jgi:hypothetical protein
MAKNILVIFKMESFKEKVYIIIYRANLSIKDYSNKTVTMG